MSLRDFSTWILRFSELAKYSIECLKCMHFDLIEYMGVAGDG